MTLRSRATRVVLGVLLLLAPASPARAYDYDTHYLWTYYLALQVGYSPRQAYQIASATFSIDYDPETGPLEATAFEALRNAPTEATENVWTRFHAFADARYSSLEELTPGGWTELEQRATGNLLAVLRRSQAPPMAIVSGDPAMVRQLRDQNATALWQAAVEEGNPGPYLHFLQDIYSHWDFDSRHGHLYASHAPDYLSYNPRRSREMTAETIRALRRFGETRGIATREPDPATVSKVLDALIAANPPVWALQTRFYDELLQAVNDAFGNTVGSLNEWLGLLDPKNRALVAKVSGIGSPEGAKAWRILVDAIETDRQSGRLPSFPEIWFEQTVPQQWLQYNYDVAGRTAHASFNRDRYAVEWPEIVVGDAQLSCTPEPDTRDLVRLTLRVPYEIRGAASLNFQHPLPIYNTSVQSDSGAQKPGTLERENGRYTIERYVLRSRAALAAQPGTWTETIAVGPGNQRAVVEAPLTCGDAPRQIGPAQIACPVSTSQGEAHYAILNGVVQDGTACRPLIGGLGGVWCSVRCEYGPPSSPMFVNFGLMKTWAFVTWAVEMTPAEQKYACRTLPGPVAILRSASSGRNPRLPDGTPITRAGSEHDPVADAEAKRLEGLLHGAVNSYALACSGNLSPVRAAPRTRTTSWLRPQASATSAAAQPAVRGTGNAGAGTSSEVLPPPAAGPTRISFGGRTVDATYEQQIDARGVAIDQYFYRTPTVPGQPIPGAAQEWRRFVRQPSARTTSAEPVVWFHAHWQYGPNGWVYVQERDVAPPQIPR